MIVQIEEVRRSTSPLYTHDNSFNVDIPTTLLPIIDTLRILYNYPISVQVEEY